MKRIVSSIALAAASMTVTAQCPVAPANTPSEAAKKLAISKLSQFLKCDANDPVNDQSPCNTFASRGLEAIYGVQDFKTGGATHQSANQMWDTASAKWTKLGPVLDEDNNLCAQSIANQGWPVVALMKASGHGHVALVIPGEPAMSASWKMHAANSASFFLNQPASVYISKPLSSAFGPANAQKAAFFYRKP